METRRRQWVEHNSLRSRRPMMLIFTEGAWEELLPVESMTCETEFARTVERGLRMRIYTFEHFQDDSVIEAGWVDEDWQALGDRHPAPPVHSSPRRLGFRAGHPG